MVARTNRRRSQSTRLQRWLYGIRHSGTPDYLLAAVVLLLAVIGLMMVYSATFDKSLNDHGNRFALMVVQARWTLAGLIIMVVVSFVPYDVWQRWAVVIMAVALISLVLVLLVGSDVHGARRSFLRGSIQPGEAAKLAMVIYVATWVTSKGDQIRDVTYGLIPFAVLIGLVAGLIILQPDISTAVLIVCTAVAIFYFAGADLFQMSIGGLIAGATFLILINQFAHAKERLDGWLARWRGQELHWHVAQAYISFGSGGLFGVGLGRGPEKFGWLPAAETDSIFAVVGEELGFVGCLFVIGLFTVLAVRGFKIASEAREPFAAILACGLTCSLVFQALANMAVVTGVIPFTGVALPLISSGGSAKIVALTSVGLLLSISRGRRSGKASRARRARKAADLGRGRRDRRTRIPRPSRRSGARR